MKRIFIKIMIPALVIFLSVLLCAPAILQAQPVLVSVTVTPEYEELPALGQTIQYTAIARYDDDSEVDVTATATWGIDDPGIATNNGGGLFTATAFGGTSVSATFEGVTGYAELYVREPWLSISPGEPGEVTYFWLYAGGCNSLSWELVVTKDGNGTVLTTSGTITSDDWDHEVSTTLDAGDYTATFSVGGTAQQVQTFSIWGFESSMNISVGYAGEVTKFSFYATNSLGRNATFNLLKEMSDGSWSSIYDEKISIDSDDWNYTITQTLAAGTYWTYFFIEEYWVDGYNFSVVDRGEQQPPVVVENAVVEKAVAKKAAAVKHGPAINEKPLSGYEKTASGFSTLFYNRLLRRNPEKEGLDAWIARLESGEITGSDLIQQFIFGEECQKIISGYSNEEFITFLYKAIFNRVPGEDGLNAWLTRMSAGMTKEEVVKQFGLSEEFVILCNFFGIKPYPGYIENSN